MTFLGVLFSNQSFDRQNLRYLLLVLLGNYRVQMVVCCHVYALVTFSLEGLRYVDNFRHSNIQSEHRMHLYS